MGPSVTKFWKYWPLPSLIDEIHKVVHVDEPLPSVDS